MSAVKAPRRGQPETCPLPLASIRTDSGAQMRPRLDDAQLRYLEELVADGAEIDPPDVFFDGGDYWLAHGFHRVEAFSRSGAPSAVCRVHEGSREDAIVFGAGANSRESTPRCEATVHKAVETVLSMTDMSEREICRHCGVTKGVVHRVKQKLGLVVPKAKPEVPRAGHLSVVRPEPAGTAGPDREPEPEPETYPEREPGCDDDLGDGEAEVPRAGHPEPAVKAGDRIGDEEWLEGHPARASLNDRCRRIFDRNALAYRQLHEHDGFGSAARLIAKLIDDKHIRGSQGPYLGKLRSFVRIPHPKDWKACRACGGHGQASGDICGPCKGDGFAII